LAATGRGGYSDGEGGGPWQRWGEAATGRAEDLGGDGERRRREAATESGGDGEGRGPWLRWGAAVMGRTEEEEVWQSHCSPNNTWSARWHKCVCSCGT
jgi:hypothetical protein